MSQISAEYDSLLLTHLKLLTLIIMAATMTIINTQRDERNKMAIRGSENWHFWPNVIEESAPRQRHFFLDSEIITRNFQNRLAKMAFDQVTKINVELLVKFANFEPKS